VALIGVVAARINHFDGVKPASAAAGAALESPGLHLGRNGKLPTGCPPRQLGQRVAANMAVAMGRQDMGDYGVETTWGDPKTGREQKALELWGDVVAQNEKDIANGLIERWDGIVYEPSAGPPAGAMRFYGTQDQIEKYIRSDTFQDVLTRAVTLLDNVGIRRFLSGDALAQDFARYANVLNSL
jgi:hypothetical protein